MMQNSMDKDNKPQPRWVFMAALLFWAALWAVPCWGQTGGQVNYLYDDDGRLRAVIAPNGEVAVYEYDPAGNFTAIRRLTANDLEILGFTPRQGAVGTPVTVYGVGFAGASAVSFNGVPATIVSATAVSVNTFVPEGATTGPISLVTPRGTAVSAAQFLVRGIRLTPQTIVLPAAESAQFTLTINGTPSNSVTWSVNNVNGGDANLGTITASGFYTAPNLSGGNVVQFTVRATSVDDPELFGEATVTVVPFGAGFQFRSEGVSVRYGTPPNNAPTYTDGAVSVRYGTPPNNAPTYTDGAVSVRYGTPPNNAPTEASGAVSVSRGPVLTSLTPATIARGASVTLTVNGVALTGATSLRFFRLSNGAVENNITVTNINVNGAGTSLTATVTVASGVAVGGYVVVVATPAGSTVRNDAGNNTVQIN